MPVLNNLTTYQRDYLNPNTEEAYITYPNCMIANPNRLATINSILYPQIMHLPDDGIVSGVVVDIVVSGSNNVITITPGVIKARKKLIYLAPKTFQVSLNNVKNTFSNFNKIYLYGQVTDNIINNPNTENYNSISLNLSDQPVNTSPNDTDLRFNIAALIHNVNTGALSVDYNETENFRLL